MVSLLDPVHPLRRENVEVGLIFQEVGNQTSCYKTVALLFLEGVDGEMLGGDACYLGKGLLVDVVVHRGLYEFVEIKESLESSLVTILLL